MNKNILKEYVDACKLVEETEKDIKKLERKKKTIVHESVKGSMTEFPYAPQHFHIEGSAFTYEDDSSIRREENILRLRKERAKEIQLEAESIMNMAPMRKQRLFRFRMIQKRKWEDIAALMDEGKSGDAYRKEFEDFLTNED